MIVIGVPLWKSSWKAWIRTICAINSGSYGQRIDQISRATQHTDSKFPQQESVRF